MTIPIEITQGTWSEVSIAKVQTEVLGKLFVHDCEVKNQSSLSRSGENCLLVQVNLLPYKGNSTTPKVLSASLKANISKISPPGLFLSSGFLIRLNRQQVTNSLLEAFEYF